MSSHACGGGCCQSFFLSVSPVDLGANYVALKARQAAGEDLTDFERDVIFVAEMVVRIDEDDEYSPRYRCSHLDENNGRCREYDQRPAMCRDFPNYGGPTACFECGFSDGSSCSVDQP